MRRHPAPILGPRMTGVPSSARGTMDERAERWKTPEIIMPSSGAMLACSAAMPLAADGAHEAE